MHLYVYVCMHVCIHFASQKGYQHPVFTEKEKKTDAESLLSNHMPTLPLESHVSLWESPHAEYFC